MPFEEIPESKIIAITSQLDNLSLGESKVESNETKEEEIKQRSITKEIGNYKVKTKGCLLSDVEIFKGINDFKTEKINTRIPTSEFIHKNSIYYFDRFDKNIPISDKERLKDEIFEIERISINKTADGKDITEEDGGEIFLYVSFDNKHRMWYRKDKCSFTVMCEVHDI